MTRDRFGELVDEQAETVAVDHDPRCVNGWLGDGDSPLPCPTCKPWLAACSTCGTSRKRCEFDRAKLRGRCCPSCPHTPPVSTHRRLRRGKPQEAKR